MLEISEYLRVFDFRFPLRQLRLRSIQADKANGFLGLRQIGAQNLRRLEFERISEHFASVFLLVDVSREQQPMSIVHSD